MSNTLSNKTVVPEFHHFLVFFSVLLLGRMKIDDVDVSATLPDFTR
jgi:hypothetical protein